MQPSITILCSSPGYGGLEMNTLKLAEALRKHGWSVSVLAVANSAFFNAAKEAGFVVEAISPHKSSRTVWRARCIAQWMKEQDSHLLLTPFNKDIAAAALAKRFFYPRMKLVYQQHMKIGVSKRDLIHSWRYAMLDAWIAPLQYLKEEVLQKTRVPEEKIQVIPFGIDVEYFAGNPLSKREARSLLNLPQSAPMLGVIGRIDPKKGQDFLIESLPYLEEKTGISYHLLIAGAATIGEGGAYEKSLYEKVQALGLEGRVHFRTASKDVRPFYRAIDVFVMPSEGETYGMVTLEAMASGVPVIGTNRDGTREILGEGKLGALYEPGSVAHFCDALASLRKSISPYSSMEIKSIIHDFNFASVVVHIVFCLNFLLKKSA